MGRVSETTMLKRTAIAVTVSALAGTAVAAVAPVTTGAAFACPTLPTPTPTTLTASAPVRPADGNGRSFIVCSGKVRSFDGTPLDVDISIPDYAYQTAKGVPLVGFIHGWGGSKTDWESTTWAANGADPWHWNNAWFATQGDVVLNYSTRGFHLSCGKDTGGYTYTKDTTCSDTAGEKSWTHLADRRWEIHDFQYLVSLLADAHVGINDNQIVATGGSYGGGQSWDLALSQNKVVSSSCTDATKLSCYSAWVSKTAHTPLKLAAALPMYPWTDLVDALTSNGKASDGFHGAPANGNHLAPFGVEKDSYVTGLYADGQATAQYASPNTDPTADLSSWYAAISAGEPTYSANPLSSTIVSQVGGAFRSPFAIPIPTAANQVPVYVIQGLTDPLFDGLQAVDMINRLHASFPNYPVWAFLGDVGHSYADNPAAVWHQAHNASNHWLTEVLHAQAPTEPRVTVDTTKCVTGQTLTTYTAATFDKIATTTLSRTSAAAQSTVSSTAASSEGTQTDPIANGGCRTMATSQSDPNQWTHTWSLSAATLLGSPVVKATAAITGSSAELAARLWDVNPATGNQTLVARTVYRLDEGTSPMTTVNLAFELWPNAWQFCSGHEVKLELTQDDLPVWRTDDTSSSISLSNLSLTLPAVQSSPC
jgi:pimeloyl-ACP methyl ester carboxylesterase